MANISQIIKCEGDNNTFGLSVVCLGAVATGFNKTEHVGEIGGENYGLCRLDGKSN